MSRWDGRADRSTEKAVWAAVNAVRARSPRADACIRSVAAAPGAVALAMSLLHQAVAGTAERGWRPADLDHVLTRKLSRAHAGAAGGDGLGGRPRSVADGMRLVVETLALVLTLPALPADDGGGDGDLSGLDPKVLTRVRGLLSKAESTEFEHEAEALTAKAQQLIARHAIDALSIAHDAERPTSRRIYLDDPYLDAKAMLLDGVARANRCSAVLSPALGWSTVFGFAGDLDAVELLTGSLLAQAAHALAREASPVDARGRSRTTSFRRAFLVAFAHRVGQRLQGATATQVAADHSDRLLPVLAARDERVAQLRAAIFPTVTSRTTRVSNAGGWAAGHAAAEAADLSVGAGAVAPRSDGER